MPTLIACTGAAWIAASGTQAEANMVLMEDFLLEFACGDRGGGPTRGRINDRATSTAAGVRTLLLGRTLGQSAGIGTPSI